MSAVPYSLEALRQYRQRKEQGELRPAPMLNDIPPEAPMEEGIVLGCWNGEAFVSWEKWLATIPIVPDRNEAKPYVPAGAGCVTSECGGRRISLVRDGDRWLMFAGSRKAKDRRRDFASPFLEHAIRTAEEWYGTASTGWDEEE